MGENQHVDRLAPHQLPHVLIAHGERTVREGLVGILCRAGYDVDDATDLDESLVVLDKGEVQALVVSYRIPPGGCGALFDAREALPPTVLLSGPADDAEGMAADLRVQSVLTRPFPLQALYDAVAKATSQPNDLEHQQNQESRTTEMRRDWR
jgi:DNA-binding NtrC family response regulator